MLLLIELEGQRGCPRARAMWPQWDILWELDFAAKDKVQGREEYKYLTWNINALVPPLLSLCSVSCWIFPGETLSKSLLLRKLGYCNLQKSNYGGWKGQAKAAKWSESKWGRWAARRVLWHKPRQITSQDPLWPLSPEETQGHERYVASERWPFNQFTSHLPYSHADSWRSDLLPSTGRCLN